MHYKVGTVIIGGGPSGTACGYYLQAKGIPNIIIEKKTYPRDKLCAGLVTTKTYRMIGKIWDAEAMKTAEIELTEDHSGGFVKMEGGDIYHFIV